MSRKRALVIGNDTYEHSPLNNCVKDATDFADALKNKCNYQVTLHTNMKSEGLQESIDKFINSTTSKDTIIFYFSGHACQSCNHNFLLPCNNKNITNATSIQRYAVNVSATIVDIAEMNPRVVVFLLDCCRNYSRPPMKLNKSSANKQIFGLSEMKVPEKTLAVFPCAIGEVLPIQAKSENNELFTKYLIKHITTSKNHIEAVLTEMAYDIAEQTHYEQQPYRIGHLNTKVFFIDPGKSTIYSCLRKILINS